MLDRGIDNLIYTRQGEDIFQTCFVQVPIVYTYSPLTTLLWNQHHIGKPFGVLNLFDKTCSQKIIYLCLNNLMAIQVETPHFLSYWFGYAVCERPTSGQFRSYLSDSRLTHLCFLTIRVVSALFPHWIVEN